MALLQPEQINIKTADVPDPYVALQVWTAAADPGVSDDLDGGWAAGSFWYNSTAGRLWVCADNTNGAAVWVKIRSGANLTFAEGENIVVGTSTGTKIGTSSTQRLGFYDATPVVRPATSGAITDNIGGGSAGGTLDTIAGSDTVDQAKLDTALSTLAKTVNEIRDKLVTLGLVS